MMLYRLLERLNREIFTPEVVALLSLEGPLKAMIENLDVPVYAIGMKAKWDLSVVVNVSQYLKMSRPRILHTQLFAADIIGRLLGRLHKVPVVVTSIRNICYGGRLRDLLIKWTDRYALKTTVVSTRAANRLVKDGIVPAEKILVIHNGLDPSDFRLNLSEIEIAETKKKLGIPEHAFLMLAVGSLTRQKGYGDLLYALKLLGDHGKLFHLVVAGEGGLEQEFVWLVNDNGLAERVTFIGRSDDVARLMALADILVLSSLWEGLPGVVMEAMASALPVVATEVGGTPELVVDGVTGYLASPGIPDKLAEALTKMIELSPEERRRMGRAGRRRVEQEFHVDKMVKAYEDLYIACIRVKNADRGW